MDHAEMPSGKKDRDGEMVSEFFLEEKTYEKGELAECLRYKEDEFDKLAEKLKTSGVFQEVPGNQEKQYKFTFVGVVIADGRVLKCLPKYLCAKYPCGAGDAEKEKQNEEKKKDLKQVLRVLEKYKRSVKSDEDESPLNDRSADSSFDLLTVILFLLNDYFENGPYDSAEYVIESNGTGEILWDKTVNETFMLLSDGKPYYPDLKTRKRVCDPDDYFRKLHECILTRASNELESAGLADVFGITEVCLSDEELVNFGDKDNILYKIEKERNVQFSTRKQLLLDVMHTYISRDKHLSDTDRPYMYGTSSFHAVWEKVCGFVFENQLEKRLEDLKLPEALGQNYKGDRQLLELIEKPYWSATGQTSAETLRPDAVTIIGTRFIISDAKYYIPTLYNGNPPRNQPGIGDITKQYLYQLAYRKFIDAHGFTETVNCFIFPTSEKEKQDKGYVEMNILHDLGLTNIKVLFLPAEDAYESYLSDKPFDQEKQNAFFGSSDETTDN